MRRVKPKFRYVITVAQPTPWVRTHVNKIGADEGSVCTLPRYRTCTPTFDNGTGQHDINFGTLSREGEELAASKDDVQSGLDPSSLPPLKIQDCPDRRRITLDQRRVYP